MKPWDLEKLSQMGKTRLSRKAVAVEKKKAQEILEIKGNFTMDKASSNQNQTLHTMAMSVQWRCRDTIAGRSITICARR